jgi:predicted HicB family RNase H-like nuclease
MNNIEYKSYTGSIEYCREDDLLYGKVLGIKGLISYEGKTGSDLEADFREAIDTYLTDCKNEGIQPEKPFKGSFNVRISPELHQSAALIAMRNKMSLNSFVAESIKERISKETGRQ